MYSEMATERWPEVYLVFLVYLALVSMKFARKTSGIVSRSWKQLAENRRSWRHTVKEDTMMGVKKRNQLFRSDAGSRASNVRPFHIPTSSITPAEEIGLLSSSKGCSKQDCILINVLTLYPEVNVWLTKIPYSQRYKRLQESSPFSFLFVCF